MMRLTIAFILSLSVLAPFAHAQDMIDSVTDASFTGIEQDCNGKCMSQVANKNHFGETPDEAASDQWMRTVYGDEGKKKDAGAER